jgi:uncharacterized membrane protein HdeD (DUF308 family)
VLGILWAGLGVAIIFDASDGISVVATHVFGWCLIVEAVIAVVMMIGAGGAGSLYVARAAVLVGLGALIVDFPIRVDLANSVLFGLAFLVDGSVRFATASTIRYRKWPVVAAAGILEILFALSAFSGWPASYRKTVPICIGIALLVTGWNAVRIGEVLRRLRDTRDLRTLPLFDLRTWHGLLPQAPDATPAERRPQHKLVLHVWTPVGSAVDPARRPLIDRYIAAVDGKGVISTGHSAIEMAPDLYISHYPAVEIDHAPSDFRALLRATAENDVPGRFQPSYAIETADWCEADEHVKFRHYDPAKLRAFWDAYRRDDTYNLTNRNCSVAAAAALDAALEGAKASRFVWGSFLLLLLDPDLWLAALIRSKAEAMTWTPGLVLDYARAIRRVSEPLSLGWLGRSADTLRRWRETRSFERLRREVAEAQLKALGGETRP